MRVPQALDGAPQTSGEGGNVAVHPHGPVYDGSSIVGSSGCGR